MIKKFLFFTSKHLLTVVFTVGIFWPFFAMFARSKEQIGENGSMAEFPKKINREFPKKFESYYMDNFPNRKRLVRRYNKHRFKKFGINSYLLFGDEGWVFFNSKAIEQTDAVGDFLGTNKFSERLLKDNIDHLIREIAHMEALGAKVYVMIAPNKSTVYPEKMPIDYKGRQAEETKVDQIMKALKERGVKVVESKKAIVKAKEKGVTYYRKDTHWNELGAFAAYKELEKALIADKVKGVRAIEFVKMKKGEKVSADLQKYLLDGNEWAEENWDITYSRPLDAECKNIGKGKLELNVEEIICTASIKDGKKMLMIRDSFASAMIPVLSTQFSKSIYMWRGHVEDAEIKQRIEEERPDVIILEYVERFVGHIADKIFE